MKAGISTASLFNRKDNDEALAYLDERGVKYSEVFLTSFCEYEPSFAEKLKEKKGNIDVNSVHTLTTQFEPQLFSFNYKVVADSYALLEKTMKSAEILDAKFYTFHGVARLKRQSKYDNYKFYGECMRKIYDFCIRYGVELSLENVEWSMYNKPGFFSEMKKYCPELRGTLDVKQARISGFDYRDYLSEMGESLSHVHISDIDENGKMCLPGKGVFDFCELKDRLKDVGFDGCVLIEAYEKDYRDLDELIDSYEYIENIIQK